MHRKPVSRREHAESGTVSMDTIDNQHEANDRWFRAVADYTYDWESWHDADGQLVWVNPAVLRTTGCSVSECLAMSEYPLELVVAEDRPLVAQALREARDKRSGENVEFRVRHRTTGELRWMSLCWQPMYGPQERYLGFRTSIRDITERQHLREQLRQHAEELEHLVQQRTERLKRLERRSRQMEKLAALGQLAAGVAHEINNPLAGIRNAFELIRSGLTPEHRHYELLDLVDREIDRVSGIVHQMYQLYRRHPQPTAEFALERTVGEVAYLLDKVATENRVVLTYEPRVETIVVQLAEGEVKQILFNLISNAIQASPAGGEVVLRLTADEHEAAVEVRDSGPGIPDDLLPHIFDPFFSTKHNQEKAGMGLGLAVSRSLIDAMGGRIEVSSRQGAGCVFSAVFPRHPDVVREAADA